MLGVGLYPSSQSHDYQRDPRRQSRKEVHMLLVLFVLRRQIAAALLIWAVIVVLAAVVDEVDSGTLQSVE